MKRDHILLILEVRRLCWLHTHRKTPWRSKGGVMLLLLSCFSRVWLYATAKTAAHQSPPSLGFSRQEHWSGLPFLSPMHEVKLLSRVCLFVTPWTAARQAPPSMGFSRQEYCYPRASAKVMKGSSLMASLALIIAFSIFIKHNTFVNSC